MGQLDFWRAGRDFVSALPAPIASLSLVAAAKKQSTGLFFSPCSSPSVELLQKIKSTAIAMLFGALGGTRTPDLLVRSQTLYPAELPAHLLFVAIV